MNDSDPLSAELERLLEAERRRPAPPAGAKADVAASLGAAFTGRPQPLLGSVPSAPGPRAPSWTRVAPALGAAFLMGTGFGAWLVAQHHQTAALTPSAHEPLTLATASALAEPARPAPQAPPPAPSADPSKAPSLPHAMPIGNASASRGATLDSIENLADTRLAAERALVDTARSALARGDAASALAVLARHVTQFPNGQLSEERSALTVQALASAGRVQEARAHAGRFRLRYPDSLLLPVVDQAVAARP